MLTRHLEKLDQAFLKDCLDPRLRQIAIARERAGRAAAMTSLIFSIAVGMIGLFAGAHLQTGALPGLEGLAMLPVALGIGMVGPSAQFLFRIFTSTSNLRLLLFLTHAPVRSVETPLETRAD